jgi:hypothetical protein
MRDTDPDVAKIKAILAGARVFGEYDEEPAKMGRPGYDLHCRERSIEAAFQVVADYFPRDAVTTRPRKNGYQGERTYRTEMVILTPAQIAEIDARLNVLDVPAPIQPVSEE